MLRRGTNNPNRQRAMSFAAPFFGWDVPSVKVTTNPKAMENAYGKVASQWHKKRKRELPYSWFPGAQLRLDKKGRKHIVFVNKKNMWERRDQTPAEMERTYVHELFHVFYERKRRMQGKKVFMICAEIIAHVGGLEYARTHAQKEYDRNIRDRNLPLGSIPSQFALGLAGVIHRNFFPQEREAIINELMDKSFSTQTHALKWLLAKMHEKGRTEPDAERQMKSYIARHPR